MKRFLILGGLIAGALIVGLLVYVMRPEPQPVTAVPPPSPTVRTVTRTEEPLPPLPVEPTERPSSPTLTTPKSTAPDLADPRASCATVLRAFRARDVAAIRAALTAKDEDRLNVFCGAVPVMFALGDLTEACAEKFADVDQSNVLRRWQASAWDEALARVPQAVLNVEGETATLKFADEQTRVPFPTNFRKVGDAWKLDLGNTEPNRKERLWAAHSETLIGIIQETIAEVREGKYQTGREALRAIEAKAEAQIQRFKDPQ